jgi:hypothetical protein
MRQLFSKFSLGSGHTKGRIRLAQYRRLTSCNLHLYNIRICRQWKAESIECFFVDDQAFLKSYDSSHRPPPSPFPLQFPSARCLSFSVFLCVAGRACWWERRRGRGAKSYDHRKAWSSTNHSILSGGHIQNIWNPCMQDFLRSESEQNYYLLR